MHLADRVKIIPKIQAMVFGMSSDQEVNNILEEHGLEAIILQVKEFNKVKKVLSNCVIEHGSKKLLYVDVMHSLLKDLKMNYKMKTMEETN
jgi:hypothetical protein